jgi:hypothetical protein
MSSAWRSLVVSLLLTGCVIQEPAPPAPAPEAAPADEAGSAPPAPVVFVPIGPTDEALVFARVVAVDFAGKISVESERGPTEVWVVDARRYRFGDPVRIDIAVRSVRVERQTEDTAPTPPPTSTEPGDHAIVTGRVTDTDTRGMITVESPRGPIRVWVRKEELRRHPVGSYVEVRTRVLPDRQP